MGLAVQGNKGKVVAEKAGMLYNKKEHDGQIMKLNLKTLGLSPGWHRFTLQGKTVDTQLKANAPRKSKHNPNRKNGVQSGEQAAGMALPGSPTLPLAGLPYMSW